MIWHPAETAPKDGTVILAWFPGMDWPEAIRWDEYPEDAKEEYGEGYWTYADDLLQDAIGHDADTFTVWTPITKPEGVE